MNDRKDFDATYFQTVAMELGLNKAVGTRAFICLRAHYITSFSELAEEDERDVFRYRNLGELSKRVVVEVKRRWLAESEAAPPTEVPPAEPAWAKLDVRKCAAVKFRDEVTIKTRGEAIAFVVELPPN